MSPILPVRLLDRRAFGRAALAAAVGLPLATLVGTRASRAAATAKRFIVFYFPDGVAGPSQNGEPSLWHPTGTEHDFVLGEQLEPLETRRDDCVFFRGLSMGPTDAGSHPGGARKLLTATDGGQGESIDQLLARTAFADAPFRHLYLGAMATENGASGDKHISYPSPGASITPIDDPRQAFALLFGAGAGAPADGGGGEDATTAKKRSVIDGAKADLEAFRTGLGGVEASKLDLHLESLRELEQRLDGLGPLPASCRAASPPAVEDADLHDPASFPEVLRAQVDLLVLALACGLTRVGVLQASQHTSELVMSRFPDTEMYDPAFDMRSHQASHYGPAHDPAKREFTAYVAQRRWFVKQFAYLLDQLAARPDEGGTMLDTSLVLLCTEVCDGNTHLHDDMPFVLGGRGGGLSTGRLLQYGGARHADLLLAIAHAAGQPLGGFGDASSGPLSGLF